MSKQVGTVISWENLEQLYHRRQRAIAAATVHRDKLLAELKQAEEVLKNLRSGTVADAPSSKPKVSVPDAIEQVLLKNGNAMTVKDIVETIVKSGNTINDRKFQKTVNARLQNKLRFRRIAPGLYDLANRSTEQLQDIRQDAHKITRNAPLANSEPLWMTAVKVLHGGPLHANALADELISRGYKTNSDKKTFVHSVSSCLERNKNRFKRISPRTYALVSWNTAQ